MSWDQHKIFRIFRNFIFKKTYLTNIFSAIYPKKRLIWFKGLGNFLALLSRENFHKTKTGILVVSISLLLNVICINVKFENIFHLELVFNLIQAITLFHNVSSASNNLNNQITVWDG